MPWMFLTRSSRGQNCASSSRSHAVRPISLTTAGSCTTGRHSSIIPSWSGGVIWCDYGCARGASMPSPAEIEDGNPDRDVALPPQSDPAEKRLLRLRRQIGLALAPVAFLGVLAIPITGITPPAHRLAAVIAAVIVLWISEALPMPLTALIGAAACVLLQVASAKEVFLPFADPLIFLFIGSFILARSLFLHRLDRRLTFAILSIPWVGTRPGRVLFAFGAVTAFISAWVANAATTAMMYAIAMSVINYLFDPRRKEGPLVSRSYATGLMLMTTFAASVGGLATPVGAAPNLIGLGFIRNRLKIDFSFFDFCIVGAPTAMVLFLFVSFYLGLLCRAGTREITGSRELFAS